MVKAAAETKGESAILISFSLNENFIAFHHDFWVTIIFPLITNITIAIITIITIITITTITYIIITINTLKVNIHLPISVVNHS